MFKSTLIWKMAWMNLTRNPRQTLLSIAGGCMGSALIIASVVFYMSFDYSGEQWLEAHYGPIEWSLAPAEESYFAEEVVKEELQRFDKYQLDAIAVVSGTIPLTTVNNDTISTRNPFVILGIDMQKAALFDAHVAALWKHSLAIDELIISKPAAENLGISVGDVLALRGDTDRELKFKVTHIAEEKGLFGFRNSTRYAAGTIIINEAAATELVGVPNGAANLLLVKRTNSQRPGNEPAVFLPMSIEEQAKYQISNERQTAIQILHNTKMKYGLLFILAGGIAVAAGFVLLLQILWMTAESRREHYGIVRALGFTRGKVRRIFLVESTVLHLLCTLAGIIIGSSIGYALVTFFSTTYGDRLQRTDGLSIPIVPYLSVPGILLTGTLIWIILFLTSLVVSYSISRMPIVSALRGKGAGEQFHLPGAIRVGMNRLITIIAVLTVILHFYWLVSGKGVTMLQAMGASFSLEGGIVLVVWFGAALIAVRIWLLAVPTFFRWTEPLWRKVGFPLVSLQLAAVYPRSNPRRSNSVALMFSMVFMILVLISTVSTNVLEYEDVDRTDQSIIGFPAQIVYRDEVEKSRIVSAIKEDTWLQRNISQLNYVEPYMVTVDLAGIRTGKVMQMSLLPVNESYMASGRTQLTNRSSKFSSDLEAWEALASDSRYIILNKRYSLAASEWSDMYSTSSLPARPVEIGEVIEMTVYSNHFIVDDKQPVETIKLEVIGFHNANGGNGMYNLQFISPQLHKALSIHGYKWPNHPELGYALFYPDDVKLRTIIELEKRLASHNISGLSVPYEAKAVQNEMTKQMIYIVISFIVLSVLIGLFGLAIIQYRAVQERSKQMAMLRCIGVSSSDIRQIYIVEGSVIGTIGLLNGLLFGSSGAYLFNQFYESQLGPLVERITGNYPYGFITILLLGLLAVTWLINITPAKQAEKLSPAAAIRSVE